MRRTVAAEDRGVAAALRVRQHELRQARQDYQRRRQRAEAMAAALAGAQSHLRSVQDWQRRLLTQGPTVDVERTRTAAQYLAWQQQVVAEADARMQSADTAAEQARVDLMACFAQTQALRRLLERHRLQRQRESDRRMATVLDELGAVRRHVLKHIHTDRGAR